MGMADLGDRNEQECDATKQKWRRVKVRFSSDTYRNGMEWNGMECGRSERTCWVVPSGVMGP